MHTALVAGWSALMLLYELITIDPVYNPIWRQAAYTLPFISRIGIIRSLFSWSLGIDPTSNLIWTYETMNTAHILLSGLLILAAFWHWAIRFVKATFNLQAHTRLAYGVISSHHRWIAWHFYMVQWLLLS